MSAQPDITVVAFSLAGKGYRKHGLLGWLVLEVEDLLLIDGVSLRRTRCGSLRLSWPERCDRDGRRHSYVRPLNEATRKQIEDVIVPQLQRIVRDTAREADQ